MHFKGIFYFDIYSFYISCYIATDIEFSFNKDKIK